MLIDRKVSIVARAMIIAASVTLFTSMPAAAFPKIALPQGLQAKLSAVPMPSSKNNSQNQDASRSPLIVDIGARKQLFDGDFLCEYSDHQPNLHTTTNQF